jgi:hypothetical protein
LRPGKKGQPHQHSEQHDDRSGRQYPDARVTPPPPLPPSLVHYHEPTV